MATRPSTRKTPARSGTPLGFEAARFKAADKLRGNREPPDYKHVALGLVFLKCISDAFKARHGLTPSRGRPEHWDGDIHGLASAMR